MVNSIRVALLHGYALEGSGSNVYVQNLSSHLAEQGHHVHVVCQDRAWPPPPQVAEVRFYRHDGSTKETRCSSHVGARVLVHQPSLGPVLPVYNWDSYPGFERVVPFTELDDDELERYIESHTNALRSVVEEHDIQVIHANHVVAMPEVARRVSESTGVPFIIMPHGSAIEYTVRRDERYLHLAERSLRECAAVVVGGDEMLDRMDAVWGGSLGHRAKAHSIPTGVDLEVFRLPSESIAPVQREEAQGLGNHRELAAFLSDEASSLDTDHDLIELVDAHRSRYSAHHPDGDFEESLRELDFEGNRVVFFGGKLVAGKGVHTLIAAMVEVCEVDPLARLAIVGQGTFREALQLLLAALVRGDHALFARVVRLGWKFDGKTAAPLEELQPFVDKTRFHALHETAKRVELNERIRFMGYLTHSRLAELLRHSVLAVLPSAIPEAYPLSLAESLAAGIFPVVTDHGGARFFVDGLVRDVGRPRCDFAVDPSPEAAVSSLARTLIRRLDQPRGPDPRARNIAEANYGWPSIAGAVAHLYQGTIASGGQ